MKITFWGTRGSIAAPGRDTVVYGGNTTCVEITLSSGRTVVIDAGTGIRALGDSLLQRHSPLNMHLLITHIHWDHVMGFPFFAPLFRENSHIVVDGFGRGMEGLKRVFSSNYVDGTWPIRFDDLKARIEHTQQFRRDHLALDGTRIRSHRLQHPQGGLGFSFKEETGTFIFLTDNELREDAWVGTGFKDFVRFCRGADVLVHDCQYLPEEMNIRRGWGHSDVDSVARLAQEAGVKKLLLFHHDPWRTDAAVSKMIDRCRDTIRQANFDCLVEAAQEGVSFSV
jgi:phosphoribosyl 1,2-cyclic phosphodiesterase